MTATQDDQSGYLEGNAPVCEVLFLFGGLTGFFGCLRGRFASGVLATRLPCPALDLELTFLVALLDRDACATHHRAGVSQPGVVLTASVAVPDHGPSDLQCIETSAVTTKIRVEFLHLCPVGGLELGGRRIGRDSENVIVTGSHGCRHIYPPPIAVFATRRAHHDCA